MRRSTPFQTPRRVRRTARRRHTHTPAFHRTAQTYTYTCLSAANSGAHVAVILKKNWTCEGMTTPRHCIKKKTFSRRPRKPPNPCPTLTQRHRRLVRTGRSLDLCFGVWDRRGDFFNASLKFAPTGSRTQDLRSATGTPNRLS